MRIALIGANGQLGSDLRKVLDGELLNLDAPEFDVTDEPLVADTFERFNPQCVINCAAMTNVDACEDQPGPAFAVNATGALYAARQAERVGAALVHISTDYVFGADAERTEPYAEDDAPGPISVYGVSKLAGEQLARTYCTKSCIVRTCGLYGHAGALGKGGNFVETMLRLGRERGTVRVVNDQCVSPTATRDLAERIAALITTQAYGLYHVSAIDRCTWFEFASQIFAQSDMDVRVEPIRTCEFGARAPRPRLSALCSRGLPAGVPACRTWRAMLTDYLAQRARRDALGT